MSIEKVTPNYLKKSGFELPYTIILNETIDIIPENSSLGVYLYLARKPEDWDVQEKDLMNRFSKGRDHVRKCLTILKDIGLYKKESIRDERGHITHWESTLYSQVTENPSSGRIHITEKPTSGKTHLLDNPTHTKERSLQKKEIITNVVAQPPQPTRLDLNVMCLKNKKCQDEFSKKFSKLELDIDELLEDCVMHYYLKEVPQKVSPPRFLKWIRNEQVSTYSKKETNRPYKVWSELGKYEKDLIGDYQHNKKHHKNPGLHKPMTEAELRKAAELIQFLNNSHVVTTL